MTNRERLTVSDLRDLLSTMPDHAYVHYFTDSMEERYVTGAMFMRSDGTEEVPDSVELQGHFV